MVSGATKLNLPLHLSADATPPDVLYIGKRAGRARKGRRDEKADTEHLLDPRRGHAGPGRTWRGRQRRVRVRWLVGELLGRAHGSGHGRGDECAVRSRS